MAQTTTAADPVEGMEAPPHAAAQPTSARYQRAARPTVGVLAQGILADRGFLGPLLRPAQRLLDQPRPAHLHRLLPPLPGRNANRRMRTRTSGGVGGAGVSPGAYPIPSTSEGSALQRSVRQELAPKLGRSPARRAVARRQRESPFASCRR